MAEVIDNGTTRPYCMILGIKTANTQRVQAFVLAQAKAGSSLHMEAMRVVMLSRMPDKPKSTRKKKK